MNICAASATLCAVNVNVLPAFAWGRGLLSRARRALSPM